MLSKTHRLAKTADIEAVFAKGRSFFNPFFTIKVVPRQGVPRFSVVVSTKVFKRAVDRNRLKRLLREDLRKKLKLFKAGDYVIMTKPKIAALPEPERLKNFSELCAKLK